MTKQDLTDRLLEAKKSVTELEDALKSLAAAAPYDLYSKLRSLGLTHDQCSSVCDVVEEHFVPRVKV